MLPSAINIPFSNIVKATDGVAGHTATLFLFHGSGETSPFFSFVYIYTYTLPSCCVCVWFVYNPFAIERESAVNFFFFFFLFTECFFASNASSWLRTDYCVMFLVSAFVALKEATARILSSGWTFLTSKSCPFDT